VAGPADSEDNSFAPRRNPDLLGHGAAERTLLESWRSGRLHHGWLISGASGIGKATLAYRFARFVLAGGTAEPEPGGLFGAEPAPVPASLQLDPSLAVFRRVAAGGHGDLLSIERPLDVKKGRLKKDLPVEEIRRIAPFLRLTPAEGGWRVVVVDGADLMNPSGQNALLKILEEPPASALLLLVADNPASLLPTLRSRVRKLVLDPLPEAMVTELLQRYRPDLGAAELTALSRLGEGSIGRALELAEAGGVELYRELLGVLESLPRLDLPATHKLGDKVGRAGADSAWEAVTGLLSWWLARFAKGLAVGQLAAEVVPGEEALSARLAKGAHGPAGGLDRWVEVWDNVTRLFARADSANLDRKQALINALQMIEAAAI
jgi:DNA polymerase-3 subunit delta'